MDTEREIRRAVDTGKVLFGFKQTEKSVLKGVAKLIVISGNIPTRQKEKIRQLCVVSEIPVYESAESGLSLGSICGKPFVVSVLAIEQEGKSKVLEAVKKKN